MKPLKVLFDNAVQVAYSHVKDETAKENYLSLVEEIDDRWHQETLVETDVQIITFTINKVYPDQKVTEKDVYDSIGYYN